jgi:hypothetical protein
MSAQSVGCVLCAHKNETFNTTTNTSNCCNSFTRTYTKYTNYIPWPTPCEVAEEMLTMVSCEHQAASGLNLSAFDWAEHCLKQERKIKEDYNCAEYVWRQWTVR